jgi:hypothetical protein
MKPLSHDRLQQELWQYLWNKYPQTRRCAWHTPNELIQDSFIQREITRHLKGKFPKWLARIFAQAKDRMPMLLSQRKAIGVLAGVTDLVFYWNGVLYMFDIKIGSDTISDAQKEFIAANTKQGGQFHEINTLDQGKSIIDSIFLT